MKHFKILLLISSVVLFTACGGGGGGDNTTTPPPIVDENTTIPPDENTTIPPDENTTIPPDESVFNWDDYIILPTNDFTTAITDTQDKYNIAEALVSGNTSIAYRWDFGYASGIRYPKQEALTKVSPDLKDILLNRNTRNSSGGYTHYNISLHVTKVDDIEEGDIIGQATIKYTDSIFFDDPVPVDVQVSYIDDEIIKLKFTYHDDTNDVDYNYNIEISPTIGTFGIYVYHDDASDSTLVHKLEMSPI